MRSIVNRNPTTPAALALALIAFALFPVPERAQTSPALPLSASPSPAPSPSAPPPAGRIRWSLDAHTTYVTQGTNGAGTRPPEAAGFANGDPLSPESPYDVFSSAPLVPGNASESAIFVRPAYIGKMFDAGLTFGAGYVRGSVTNAASRGG